jgi:hypothetical protein
MRFKRKRWRKEADKLKTKRRWREIKKKRTRKDDEL